MRIVVAVGGNAIVKAGQAGTWDEQLANVQRDRRGRARAARAGPRGRAHARQRPAGRRAAAPAGARRGRGRAAAARRADRGDPGADRLPARERVRRGRPDACRSPCCSPACSSTPTTTPSRTRPSRSARSTTRTEAKRRAETLGWDVAPDAGRGWRRVVPSPHPLEVLGAASTRSALLERGTVVISCGGGGIPVARRGAEVVGVAGVIDKDRCSERLACGIGADVLVLLTGVPRVSLDFGTRWEREVDRLTVTDVAARPAARASSRPGSMGPKVESAGALRARSAAAARWSPAPTGSSPRSRGDDGTWIVPDPVAHRPVAA